MPSTVVPSTQATLEEEVVARYFSQLDSCANCGLDPDTPLRRALRATDMVYKQARIYLLEADLQAAYVLLLRFCRLCLVELPKLGPASASRSDYDARMMAALRRQTQTAVTELERIKPILGEAVRRQLALGHKRQLLERIQSSREALNFSRSSLGEVSADDGSHSHESTSQAQAEETSALTISFECPGVSEGARHVQIPDGMAGAFARIAEPNTRRGIETCGVLAGTLQSNRLKVTAVVVPKQQGTSDTCAMLCEEELASVLDERALLTLGWVHTHPTQGCFLSSVDLHTQHAFQVLLPEAVAVVVAPRVSPSVGVFRIVDMATIARCPHADGFHPHAAADNDIYHEVSVEIEWIGGDDIEVVDLR